MLPTCSNRIGFKSQAAIRLHHRMISLTVSSNGGLIKRQITLRVVKIAKIKGKALEFSEAFSSNMLRQRTT